MVEDSFSKALSIHGKVCNLIMYDYLILLRSASGDIQGLNAAIGGVA